MLQISIDDGYLTDPNAVIKRGKQPRGNGGDVTNSAGDVTSFRSDVRHGSA